MTKLKVLSAEFAHETNTFSMVPTNLDNFKKQSLLITSDEVKNAKIGTRTACGATYEIAEKYQWDLHLPVSASSNPSGKILDETFETLCSLILDSIITNKVKYDGILLHLHGAMVTVSYEDAEGEFLKRIRSLVGYDIPIIVTLDLHGNITELMSLTASALIAVRTYPHIDFYERALEGGELLEKMMRKQVIPLTVFSKPPLLKGLDGGRTQDGTPLHHLLQKAEGLLKSNDSIQVISICSGFSASDIDQIGPSITVTIDISNANDDNDKDNLKEFAQGIADEFMEYAWETRNFTSVKHLSIEDAIKKATLDGEKFLKGPPLLLADVTDNPGSGHYGDSTNVLRAMIDNNLPNSLFYAIYDAEAVTEGVKIGVGNVGIITLGGKTDPTIGGKSLQLEGKVITLTDGSFPSYGPILGGAWQHLGTSMLFRVKNVDVILISNNAQALDLSQVTSLGVDPIYKTTIALKSNHHFRAHFGPISREIVTVDGGGLGSVILGNPQLYKHVRRPIWPLDFN